MKTKKKKWIAVAMATTLMAAGCPTLNVYAANAVTAPIVQNEIQPRLTYIHIAKATFSASTGAFSATVTADSSVESIDITVELQKKGLIGYSTVDTLTDTFYDDNAVYKDSFNLDSSGTYRIKVTFEVFTATGSESVVKYA